MLGSMREIEALGLFYLGPTVDAADAPGEPYLLDARELTTHGLIVGMTGSGKTGLGVVALEEAALDGMPVARDRPEGRPREPRARLPGLRARRLRPWVDPAEAARAGEPPRGRRRDGGALAPGARGDGAGRGAGRTLRRRRRGRDLHPGERAGTAALGAALLRRAAGRAPRRPRTRCASAGERPSSGPPRSPRPRRRPGHEPRAHPRGPRRRPRLGRAANSTSRPRSAESQSPPFATLGALELEAFYPGKERFTLATRLNTLLASPAFAAWREGEPLDVDELLYDGHGRPRVSVLSIAHLPDRERMFFVTLLLERSPILDAPARGDRQPAGSAVHGRDLRVLSSVRRAALEERPC